MSTSITLSPLGTSTIKYVKNGTTTDITEVKYKKGSSGTATTVWTKADLPVSQEIACSYQVSDLGTYYSLQMTFSKNSSLTGGSIFPTVTSSGTRLFCGSNKLAYMEPTLLSFETSTANKTLTVNINKTDVYSSGFTISYNDPTAGDVSYTGNFPVVVTADYQNECPQIDRYAFTWVDISGAEGTRIDTQVWGATSYTTYVTLSYYDSDGNFLGTSDRTEIAPGNDVDISKNITGWYGGKSLAIRLHTLEYSNSNIYMIDMLDEDPQFYEEYIHIIDTCTTTQKLTAPSVSLEVEYDYDDMGDGTLRTNNNLLISITNNNTTYGYVTFSTESDIGTLSSHFTEKGPSKTLAAGGSTTLRHSDILENTSARTRVTYSKAGFTTGGVVTETVGAWDDSATS